MPIREMIQLYNDRPPLEEEARKDPVLTIGGTMDDLSSDISFSLESDIDTTSIALRIPRTKNTHVLTRKDQGGFNYFIFRKEIFSIFSATEIPGKIRMIRLIGNVI